MPSITYGAGAYRRDSGDFPELKLINLFLEQSKTSEKGIALLSRPGLAEVSTVGTGPINGMFCEDGVFSGGLFSLSNQTLYQDATSIGTVAGSGVTKWAGAAGEIVTTRGASAYSYNGTDLQAIAFPDGANVRSVCRLGSLWIFLRDGTGEWYWALDARSIDALDFATAERKDDNLLDCAALGDNLWLFGESTVEPWAQTGDADLPFTRIEQVGFDKGILATGCVCNADNTLFFIGSNGSVYRLGDVPQRISDHSIEERILASSAARMFTYSRQGHEFVEIRLDNESLAYDCATGEFSENQTSQGNWIAAHAAMIGTEARFGHSSTGQIMELSGFEDLDAPLERRFTAVVQLDAPAILSRVSLWANPGQPSDITPVIELQTSDDQGRTWSGWEAADFGAEGEYRIIPEWRALGMFDAPGAMLEFRLTDAVGLRISAVKVNDPAGGRQRAA